MTLADERLKKLDNPSMTLDERLLQRCALAAGLIQEGQYEEAREALGELWPGVGVRPRVSGLPASTGAEVLFQCGALTARLGELENIREAQEHAKDLLAEAVRVFQTQGKRDRAADAQCELGACYWRLGAFDEARLLMREALESLTDADAELRAKILIRRTTVELCENRFYAALGLLKEAEPALESAGEALKGRWHGQMGLVLARLAGVEGGTENVDRAIIEFTAAIYHYEQAGHERYCALNRNNVAMLLYKLGRHRDAHEHLDRAGAALLRLGDEAVMAHVDETRARVFIAEGRYAEAERVIARAVATRESANAFAYLADALAVQGVARARLGAREESIGLLRRAIKFAEEAGAYTNAGLAALTLIEEHGALQSLPQAELYNLYVLADDYLRHTQDLEDVARLRACSRVVMRRLLGAGLHDSGFSFYGAVQEFEAKIIEQALDESGGSVTGAARLLGLKHQTLISMLGTRHKELSPKRTPPERRLRSIIKKGC